MSATSDEARLIQAVDLLQSRFDQVQTVRKYREQVEAAAREDERARIQVDLEALTDAWVHGDNVEVSRLLHKLRGE